PMKRRAADAEVLEAGFDERANLIQTEGRLEKVRIPCIEIEQRLLIFREPEVVALLFQALDLIAARRTFPIDQLRFRNKDLIDRAVPPLVIPLVDVAVGGDAAPELLRGTMVARLGGPDEIVVRDVQVAAHLTKRARHLLGKYLSLQSGLLCGAFHLLSVFVRSGQK